MAASSSSSASASASSGRSRTTPAAAASAACPICLEAFKDEAYLDTCFHSFCYKCICQWVKIVANKHSEPLSSVGCPLCKAENLSIIHGFDGESFERRYINQDPRKRHISDAHELRLQFYKSKEIASNSSSVQHYWKHRKYVQKNIWLQTWLSREIQALTRDDDVDAIVHHINGVIESFSKKHGKESASNIAPEQRREEFKSLLTNAARPFLLGRTERFVEEVELFLASHLNIDAYEKVCMQRLRDSASHETRGHDVLSHDRSLEDRYLYFASGDTDFTDERE